MQKIKELLNKWSVELKTTAIVILAMVSIEVLSDSPAIFMLLKVISIAILWTGVYYLVKDNSNK